MPSCQQGGRVHVALAGWKSPHRVHARLATSVLVPSPCVPYIVPQGSGPRLPRTSGQVMGQVCILNVPGHASLHSVCE